ncbi:MAG: hypothetical protein Q4E28_03105 [Clostridia bacterium]|nr:hypothetical protein [Clostridia bacterium]
MFSNYYFYKKIAKLNIIIISILTIFLMISTFIYKSKSFSKEENRKLAEKPKATVENVFSGEYGKAYEDYFSDHFVFRDTFINISDKFEDFLLRFHKGDKIYVNEKSQEDFLGENLEDHNKAEKK